MTGVKHGIIRASAGSGKTWQLTRRFIRLLALRVPPGKIAALTFTRKAAGEFFDRILRQLAGLAADPDKAGTYLEELRGASREHLIALLRSVIVRMDRLRLCTMDSFFAAMVRCLPFDLGLSGTGALLSEDEQSAAVEDSLDSLLREATGPEYEAVRRTLLEAWKRAFYGRESGSPIRDLEPWLKQMHPLYLAAPGMDCWGDAATIWPDRNSPVWRADKDLTKILDRPELRAAGGRFTPQGRRFFGEFIELLKTHIPGEPNFEKRDKGRLAYMLSAERGDAHRLPAGGVEWTMGAGAAVTLSAEEGAALHEALCILVGAELKCRCERTAGRRDLVELYEAMYQRLVRGQGRLVFADLPLLLAGKLGVSRTFEWRQLRLALDYRLDSSYDHWLFDEFQDTNFAQWRVFENLIAEILQDPSGQRSVFAVGDAKQSIYLWRDAEPELFREVEASLPQEGTEKEPLNNSYRSCPAVLAMVNGVFVDAARLETLLPGIGGLWDCPLHKSAGEAAAMSGHAALIEVDPGGHDGEGRATDTAVAALIRQADPLARNLTCAVIVRTNEEAARLNVRLRHLLHPERMEVMCESEEAVAVDNPVTLALLGILRVAAHPDDSAAWRHLRMTPLGQLFRQVGMTPARLGGHVRAELARSGFLGVATEWLGKIRECAGGLDGFSNRRGTQFLELASEFDETGSRDLDGFIRRAREHRRREEGQARAIQVMTVHKSKGLEFDLVILPQLGSRPMEQARDMLLACRSDRGHAEWFLERPPKSVWEWDGRLKEVVGRSQARAAYEGLCRLYVAMTRARRALYVLLPAKPQSRSEALIVRSTLADSGPAPVRDIDGIRMHFLFESGNSAWIAAEPVRAVPAAPASAFSADRVPLADLLRAVNRPVQRRTPSGAERLQISGSSLLSPQRESSRGFGTLVHRLFAEIEWLDGLRDGGVESQWAAKGLEGLEGFEAASETVRRTLADKAVREWFVKGTTGRAAWRERSFDILAGREWISGQLDRVVLEQDAGGTATRAVILDFKTDAVMDGSGLGARIAGYAPQLALYKRAVARLTGLAPGQIRCGLVFTARAELCWLDNLSPGA